jgi:hypothetical protein
MRQQVSGEEEGFPGAQENLPRKVRKSESGHKFAGSESPGSQTASGGGLFLSEKL